MVIYGIDKITLNMVRLDLVRYEITFMDLILNHNKKEHCFLPYKFNRRDIKS